MSEESDKLAKQKTQAKEAVRSKRMSEKFEQTSKRMSEWPSTYIPILGCSAPLWSAPDQA